MKIRKRRVKDGKDGKEKDAAGRWLTSHGNNTRRICGLVRVWDHETCVFVCVASGLIRKSSYLLF